MMKFGTMFNQGDILLVPIPFSDLSLNKKRPVLVLSNTDYNHKTGDIVVAAITSNINTKDYTVFFTAKDLVEGVLKMDSCIRIDKIYSISQSIIVTKFGSVNPEIMQQVREKLRELLG